MTTTSRRLLALGASLALAACDLTPVSSGLAPEPPVAVPVIGLSAATADFQALAHSLAPVQSIGISNAGAGALGGLGVAVQYFGEASGWLSATLTGTAAPAALLLQPAAGNLAPGTYYATVELTAVGATNTPRTVPVSFRIDPVAVGPIIGLTATVASFAVPLDGIATPQVVLILPASDAPLGGIAISDITYDPAATGWLRARLDSTTAPTALQLQPEVAGLGTGTYVAVVTLTAAGAINSPRTVRVVLNVVPTVVPPALQLATTSVTMSGTSPAPVSVAITNAGGGTLSGLSTGPVAYGPGASGWLGAQLSSTTAPSTLTLAASPAGLAPGSYSATLPIQAAGAAGSPQTITVTLSIAATPQPPVLSLSPSGVTFLAVTGGAAPAAQSVSISNTGGGTLSGLAAGPVLYGTGAAGWLQLSLNATTAPAVLTLSATTTGLASGSYSAMVPVSSPGASNGTQQVTVTLTVSATPPAPALALSVVGVSFTGISGGSAPAAKTVTITNGGGGTLSGISTGSISYGAGAAGWLSAGLSGATAPATLTLTPSLSGLAAGSYSATLPVLASGASNSPQTVTVTLTLSAAPPPPAIALSPSSLGFSATVGGASPAAKTVGVSNGGGGTLSGLAVGTISFAAGASGWLSASLNATTAPATLTVTAALGSLAAGSYSATIPVSAAGASNTPQSVAVTFTVAAAASVSFANDIYPVFQANCLSSGCHVPGQQKPDLSTRAAAYYNLVTAGTKYVVPGNPNTGLLLGCLQGTTGPQMPPSGKLSTTFINQVKAWIQQGAPNN